MKNIVYCAIKKVELVNETIYSILSLLRFNEWCNREANIIIITDQVKSFGAVFSKYDNIIFETIQDEIVDEWKRDTDYPFVFKIKAIQYYFNKYKENLLFIDSDTVIIQDISTLFNYIDKNEVVLHAKGLSIDKYLQFNKDKILNDNYFAPTLFYSTLRDNEGLISINSKKYEIPISFTNYNSGVIGWNYCDAYLLDEVLSLSNFIYETYKAGAAEEFAFTYVAWKESKVINTAFKEIFHYNFDKSIRYILAYIFNYYHNDERDGLCKILEEWKMTEDDLNELNLKSDCIKEIAAFNNTIKDNITNNVVRLFFKLGPYSEDNDEFTLDYDKTIVCKLLKKYYKIKLINNQNM